jgi:DnaJ homolog subfamily C member 7
LLTDEQPRRTPGIRKAKARTATTPFAAATDAANGFASFAARSGGRNIFNSTPHGGGLDNNNNEDSMAWSPSNTATEEQVSQQQQQKEQERKQQAPPPPLPSFIFGASNNNNGSSNSSPAVFGVAKEFTTRLKVDEQQQQQQPAINPFAAAAAAPPAAPFTFSAGSPQQAGGAGGGAEGVQARRRGTPHRPAAPPVPLFSSAAASGPPSPPAFVFQANPAAAPTAAVPEVQEPQKQQQQAEGFISLSQFRSTPGAPLRRRPRTKARQQKQPTPSRTTPAAAAIPNSNQGRGGAVPSNSTSSSQWNAPAAVNGRAPRQHYHQQEQKRPLLTPEQQAHAASTAADQFRMAGNDFFRKQKYEDAFKQYTQALNTLMPYPTVHNQLALLLSNRAAASLAMARPLQALQDCRMGLHHDRTFLKCATRMATCHCRLGEYSLAQEVLVQVRKELKIFDSVGLKELEGKENEVKESMAMMLDILNALGYSDIQIGIQKLTGKDEEKKVKNLNFLSSLPAPPHPAPKRASLEVLLKHLEAHGSYFPHAEVFHAARAETLLRLGRFKDALEAVANPPHVDIPASKADAPWRTWIRTQVAFYQGDAAQVQELLDIIEKVVSGGGGGSDVKDREKPAKEVFPLEDLDSIIPLPTPEQIFSIRTILKTSEELRQTGNKAVKIKNYKAAIEAYTQALSSGSLSPALAGVLYSNRAAAHQGLGNIALAVADCCRAKALHPGYAKAHSRLAALLTELGMYTSAVDELNAAIKSPDITPTLKAEYQNRLKTAKQAAAPRRTFYGATINPPPANHYKVLGLERGDATADQVRKVYKKLALQLHPDKSTTACRVSYNICSGSGAGSELSDVAVETQKRVEDGASWVFKCLGEANETLSAPEKKRELDAELSAWEAAAGGSGGRGSRGGFEYGYEGDGFSYYYSPGGHHRQHSGYSAYGAYYRPHAQPSYNFNRNQYGGVSGGASGSGRGGGGGGGYRHYW